MKSISIKRLFKSFKYAFKGIWHIMKSEQNMRVHIASSIVIVILMFYLDTSALENAMLVMAITVVLMSEIINSALERIIDIVKPRIHPEAKTMKDIMAAMVLISASGAAITGFIILLPKLFDKFT